MKKRWLAGLMKYQYKKLLVTMKMYESKNISYGTLGVVKL